MPNPSIVAPIVSEISAFIRTDGQTDMAGSTRLVILIKNVYTLWGRKLSDESSIPLYSMSNGYKNMNCYCVYAMRISLITVLIRSWETYFTTQFKSSV